MKVTNSDRGIVIPCYLLLKRELRQIVAGEMESRLLEEMEFDPRSQIHGVRDMAYAQEKRSDQSAIGIVWFFFRWAVMIGDILLGLVPIFLILAFIPRMFPLILGWLVTWYYLFHKNLRQKALTWLAFHFSSLLYRYHWREAAIRISQTSKSTTSSPTPTASSNDQRTETNSACCRESHAISICDPVSVTLSAMSQEPRNSREPWGCGKFPENLGNWGSRSFLRLLAYQHLNKIFRSLQCQPMDFASSGFW